MPDSPRILPLGDSAVTIDFGNEISVELNDRAVSLASYFNNGSLPGIIEAAPAYASVSIFYDIAEIRDNFSQFGTAFHAVRSLVESALATPPTKFEGGSRIVEIPVAFNDDSSPDIDLVANHGGLSRADVIDLFTSKTYRVHMIGFLPGFAYMGEVDERIAVPRRETPRLKVPKGSVGIAGSQTGIYPFESPGGWQIVGRTSLEMFTPNGETPCLLQPGDKVNFLPI